MKLSANDKATQNKKLPTETEHSEKTRYCVLDALRGLAVINMIVYHTLWDLVYIFNFDLPWYHSKGAYAWQQGICWTFILISGFCYPFGNKKGKAQRGAQIFLFGFLISLCTWIFMPEDSITFGVLTLIGSCMLLLLPAEKFLRKFNPIIGAVISAFLFFLTRNVNNGYLGFEGLNLLRLPDFLYSNLATAYFGFPSADFSSSDYFSLIPWFFLFITGCFLNGIFEKYSLLGLLKPHKARVIEWFGRHSLPVYVIHQPIIYAVCFIIFSGRIS